MVSYSVPIATLLTSSPMALRNGTSARFTACCGCSLTALLASDLEPLHAVAIIELHTIKAKIINLFIIIIGFQLVNNNANIRDEGYDYICKSLIDTYDLAIEKDDGTTVKGKIAGWDKNKEDLRLDLILTNKELKVIKSNVIFNDTNKNIVSDHYGVEVLVEID